MPIAHSLNKVSKNVAKSTGQMHVKGRKFKQLNRATLREQKLMQKKVKHQEQKDHELFVIKHFQDQVLAHSDKEVFLLDDMKAFLEVYLARFDEEIADLQKEKRAGRPVSSRQKILQEKKKHEQHVYETGFKVVNIADKKTVERLKLWNGSNGGVTVMDFVHIHKDMEALPTKEEKMAE